MERCLGSNTICGMVFLGLEGVANVAEETVNPQRNVLQGFGSALITLIILCALVFISSVGVGGWEKVVYPTPGAEASIRRFQWLCHR
jgi:ethanolamine permease